MSSYKSSSLANKQPIKYSRTILVHLENSVGSMCISPDGHSIYTTISDSYENRSCDDTIRVWDVSSGSCRAILKGYSRSMCISPDGKTLFSGSLDGEIIIWDVASESCRAGLDSHSNAVSSLCISPDGHTLFSGLWNNTISVWDVASESCLVVLEGHLGAVTSLCISPDGLTLFSCSHDMTVRVWNVSSGSCRAILEDHSELLHLSPDGKTLYFVSSVGTIRVWDVVLESNRAELNCHSSAVTSLCISPDGHTLFSGLGNNTISVWDTSSGTCRAILEGHSDSVYSMCISPDGETLFSSSRDKTICAWRRVTITDFPSDTRECIWKTSLFSGQFMDPYLSNINYPANSIGSAIKSFLRVLEQMLSEFRENSPYPSFGKEHLDVTRKFIKNISISLKIDEKIENAYAKLQNRDLCTASGEGSVAEVVDLIDFTLQQIDGLKKGDWLFIPSGWLPAMGPGHAIMCIVECIEPKEAYAWTTCNTGEGLHFHFSSNVAYPKMKYKTAMRISGIAYRKLNCPDFWFMLHNMTLTKSSRNTPEYYYETLLLHLLGPKVDIHENMKQNFDISGDFKNQQKSGTCASRCVLTAFKYFMKREGLSMLHHFHFKKCMSVSIRLSFLLLVQSDLADLIGSADPRTIVSQFNESDAYEIDISCKQVVSSYLKFEQLVNPVDEKNTVLADSSKIIHTLCCDVKKKLNKLQELYEMNKLLLKIPEQKDGCSQSSSGNENDHLVFEGLLHNNDEEQGSLHEKISATSKLPFIFDFPSTAPYSLEMILKNCFLSCKSIMEVSNCESSSCLSQIRSLIEDVFLKVMSFDLFDHSIGDGISDTSAFSLLEGMSFNTKTELLSILYQTMTYYVGVTLILDKVDDEYDSFMKSETSITSLAITVLFEIILRKRCLDSDGTDNLLIDTLQFCKFGVNSISSYCRLDELKIRDPRFVIARERILRFCRDKEEGILKQWFTFRAEIVNQEITSFMDVEVDCEGVKDFLRETSRQSDIDSKRSLDPEICQWSKIEPKEIFEKGFMKVDRYAVYMGFLRDLILVAALMTNEGAKSIRFAKNEILSALQDLGKTQIKETNQAFLRLLQLTYGLNNSESLFRFGVYLFGNKKGEPLLLNIRKEIPDFRVDLLKSADFDGYSSNTFSDQEANQFYSFIDVPQLAPVLALNFIAADRVESLLPKKRFQNIVDFLLFKPGPSDVKTLDDTIPSRCQLASTHGVLFDDIKYNPDIILNPLFIICKATILAVRNADFTSCYLDKFLFVVRLSVSVLKFCQHHVGIQNKESFRLLYNIIRSDDEVLGKLKHWIHQLTSDDTDFDRNLPLLMTLHSYVSRILALVLEFSDAASYEAIREFRDFIISSVFVITWQCFYDSSNPQYWHCSYCNRYNFCFTNLCQNCSKINDEEGDNKKIRRYLHLALISSVYDSMQTLRQKIKVYVAYYNGQGLTDSLLCDIVSKTKIISIPEDKGAWECVADNTASANEHFLNSALFRKSIHGVIVSLNLLSGDLNFDGLERIPFPQYIGAHKDILHITRRSMSRLPLFCLVYKEASEFYFDLTSSVPQQTLNSNVITKKHHYVVSKYIKGSGKRGFRNNKFLKSESLKLGSNYVQDIGLDSGLNDSDLVIKREPRHSPVHSSKANQSSAGGYFLFDSGLKEDQDEEFIPIDYLNGIIPGCLLEEYQFWKTGEFTVRGYSEDDSSSIFMDLKSNQIYKLDNCGQIAGVLVNIQKLDEYSSLDMSTLASLSRGKIDQCCMDGTYNVVFENGDFETKVPRAMISVHQSDSSSSICGDNDIEHIVNGMELMVGCSVIAKRRCSLWVFSKEFMKIEDLSHILVWGKPRSGGNIMETEVIFFPRLRLTFKSQRQEHGTMKYIFSDHKEELRFYSYQGIEGRRKLLSHIYGKFRNFILLSSPIGQLYLLLPNYGLSKLVFKDRPYSVNLKLNKLRTSWSDNVNSRFFLYLVHPSLSNLEFPSLSAAFYWVLVLFLHHMYDEAAKLITTVCQTDTPLTKEQHWILNQIPRNLSLPSIAPFDEHPDAHACRLLLQVILLGVGSNILDYEAKSDLLSYYQKFTQVSRSCKISHYEEKILLKKTSENAKKTKGVSIEDLKAITPYDLLINKTCQCKVSIPTLTMRDICAGYRSNMRNLLESKYQEMGIHHPSFNQGKLNGMKFLYEVLRDLEYYELDLEDADNFVIGERRIGESGFIFLFNLLVSRNWTSRGSSIPTITNINSTNSNSYTSTPNTSSNASITNTYSNSNSNITSTSITTSSNSTNTITSIATTSSTIACTTATAATNINTNTSTTSSTSTGEDGQHQNHGQDEVLDSSSEYSAWLDTNSKVLLSSGYEGNNWVLVKLLLEKYSAIYLGAPMRGFSIIYISKLRDWINGIEEKESAGVDLDEYWATLSREGNLLSGNISTVDGFLAFAGRFERLFTHDIARSDSEILSKSESEADKSDHKHCPVVQCKMDNEDKLIENIKRYKKAYRFRPQPSNCNRNKVSVKIKNIQSARYPLTYCSVSDAGHEMVIQDFNAFSGDLKKKLTERNFDGLTTSVLELKLTISSALKYNLYKSTNNMCLVEEEVNGSLEGVNKSEVIPLFLDVLKVNYLSGAYSKIDFNFLVSSLASTLQDEDLKKRNPLVAYFVANEKDFWLSNLNSQIVEALLQFQTYRQLCTCWQLCSSLLFALKTTRAEDSESLNVVENTVNELASEFVKERPYMEIIQDEYCEFDPRFLIFEYLSGFLLKRRQVELVNNFIQDSSDEKSRVEQMIMGQGKTAVIAPLLAMMLSNEKSLVTIICPDSLVQQSRIIMKQRFSYVVHKSILNLSFDRSSNDCNDLEYLTSLACKLRNARSTKAVVISTPSAVKSVFLKFIEFKLQGASKEAEANELKKILDLWGRNESEGFESAGVAILDEVDLLLHPLKSELNFPIGDGGLLPYLPIRFELPMFLLDTFINYEDIRFCKDPIHTSIQEGIKRNAFMTEPHLVLLNEEWYRDNLLVPVATLLANWLLEQDSFHQGTTCIKQLQGEDIRNFVENFLSVEYDDCVKEEFKNTVELLREKELMFLSNFAVEPLKGECIDHNASNKSKAYFSKPENLNFRVYGTLVLAREWVRRILPHCLSKRHRVTFGMIKQEDVDRWEAEEIENAGGDLAAGGRVKVSASRRLLAVPFVGKDLPSQSSEFADPDVAIGFSILAYKLDGLRRDDVESLLKHMLHCMSNEPGIYSQRKSRNLFEEWRRGSLSEKQRKVGAQKSKILVKSIINSLTKWSNGKNKISINQLDNDMSVSNLVGTTIQRFYLKWRAALEQAKLLKNRQEGASILPLELMRISDQKEVSKVWGFFHDNDNVINYYLRQVFNKVLNQKENKLQSSGVDLGGDMLFGVRLGFTGTPSQHESKMMPLELKGNCHREPNAEEEIRDTLVDKDVVSLIPNFKLDKGWTVDVLIELIADVEYEVRIPRDLIRLKGGGVAGEGLQKDDKVEGNFRGSGKWLPGKIRHDHGDSTYDVAYYHHKNYGAFIDVGALITGYSAKEVARKILKIQKRKFENNPDDPTIKRAVVYIDDRGFKKMLDWDYIERDSEWGGVKLAERFVFYDHVHTTGTDIKHSSDAIAICTLGKDMTLRDFAQGCWRMRGIGKGQQIHVLIVPEIMKMINEPIASSMTEPNSSHSGSSRGSNLILPSMGEKNRFNHASDYIRILEYWLDINRNRLSEGLSQLEGEDYFKEACIISMGSNGENSFTFDEEAKLPKRFECILQTLESETKPNSLQVKVVNWLLKNSFMSENQQFTQLKRQIIGNVWRKQIFFDVTASRNTHPVIHSVAAHEEHQVGFDGEGLEKTSCPLARHVDGEATFGDEGHCAVTHLEKVRGGALNNDIANDSANDGANDDANDNANNNATDGSSTDPNISKLLKLQLFVELLLVKAKNGARKLVFEDIHAVYTSNESWLKKRTFQMRSQKLKLHSELEVVEKWLSIPPLVRHIAHENERHACTHDNMHVSGNRSKEEDGPDQIESNCFNSEIVQEQEEEQEHEQEQEKRRENITQLYTPKDNDAYFYKLQMLLNISDENKNENSSVGADACTTIPAFQHLKNISINSITLPFPDNIFVTTRYAPPDFKVLSDVNVLAEIFDKMGIVTSFAIISLAEAATLKYILQRDNGELRTKLGLHLIYPTLKGTCLFPILDRAVVLDRLADPLTPTTAITIASATKSNPSECAIQCARFFNCELYYDDKSLFLLLEAFREKCCDDRKGFFEYAVNFCRLRDNLNYQTSSARYMFSFQDGSEIGNILKDIAVIRRELRVKMGFCSSKDAFNSLKMNFETSQNENTAAEPLEPLLVERLLETQIDNLWKGLQARQFTRNSDLNDSNYKVRLKNIYLKCSDLLMRSNVEVVTSKSSDDRSRKQSVHPLSLEVFQALFPISKHDDIESPLKINRSSEE